MKLVRHPRIYLDAKGRTTDALLLYGDRVVAIGQSAISRAEDEEAELLPLPDAACLMPALADSHVHMWGLGLREASIDLRDATSTDEIYARLKNAPPTEHGWILGTGWDQHRWSDTDQLDIRILDELSDGRPMCLRRVDGHAVWANSRALDGIDAKSFGEGGVVVVDKHGEKTGLLIDEAMDFVTQKIPPTGLSEDRQQFRNSEEMLARFGISSAHVAWVEFDRLPMLTELSDNDTLRLRIHPMLDGKNRAFDETFERGPVHTEGEKLQIAAVKFFSDGALGSQGAQLLETYPDGSSGLAIADDALLAEQIPKLVKKGWQVCIHAIGDKANRRVLSHYKNLTIAERASTRPRVEHVQMIDDVDLPHLSDVIASVQPIHLRSDATWASDVLTERQLGRLFRWRDIENRARVCGGSDYPIEDPNPWHGIATAMRREDANGERFRGEPFSRETSLRAYLSNAAYAAFWEDHLGALYPGMLADFIAIDTDPYVDEPATIWDTNVIELWIGGTSFSELSHGDR